MTKKLFSGAMIALFLLATAAVPALAAPPMDLQIEAYEVINDNSPGPFTASGAAVDAGLMCASGTVVDGSFEIRSTSGSGLRILEGTKTFTCGDGSGTFEVRMVVRLDLGTHFTTAQWKVVGGTGDYVDLKGSGSLEGIPGVPGDSITDYYDGAVH